LARATYRHEAPEARVAPCAEAHDLHGRRRGSVDELRDASIHLVGAQVRSDVDERRSARVGAGVRRQQLRVGVRRQVAGTCRGDARHERIRVCGTHGSGAPQRLPRRVSAWRLRAPARLPEREPWSVHERRKVVT